MTTEPNHRKVADEAICWCRLLLGVASAFCFLTAVFGSPEFFQRSGSLLTAAAAWSFVLISKATGSVESFGNFCEPDHFAEVRQGVAETASCMSKISGTLTVVGTVIWGYGDVLMKAI